MAQGLAGLEPAMGDGRPADHGDQQQGMGQLDLLSPRRQGFGKL